MLPIPISKDLIDDSAWDWSQEFLEYEKILRIKGDRKMGIVSDELWEYDKQQDQELIKRLEDYMRVFN